VSTRHFVILLGCASVVVGAVVLITSAVRDTELLGGGLIANGLGLIVAALPRA